VHAGMAFAYGQAMLSKCKLFVGMRILVTVAGLSAALDAFADNPANRLEHLHHAVTGVAHAMSTAQLLGHAIAKRVIGRTENQFQRDLNNCENLGAINFGEARWRLQAVDAGGKLEELAHAERLFGILLEAARQWNGTAEDAFDVIDGVGVLSYQLEKLSVGIGHMSDEELASLLQRSSGASAQTAVPTTSLSAAPVRPTDNTSRPRNAAWRSGDQNL
jgi:hypothetical protein